MIFSSFWYHSGILGFLHVKFIADFRTMVMACSGCQFGLCRWFTYRTIILPTVPPNVVGPHSAQTTPVAGPLPAGCSERHTPEGLPYYVNHNNQTTTSVDPRHPTLF